MVFGFGKPKPVKETEATGEIERVYHEIKQSLRVSGINLNFRTWADYERFFPLMWDAMRPAAETREFENAAEKFGASRSNQPPRSVKSKRNRKLNPAKARAIKSKRLSRCIITSTRNCLFLPRK